MLVPLRSLPSLPVSPAAQDNLCLLPVPPQPFPSTTLEAVVCSHAVPEGRAFAVSLLASLALGLMKNMCTKTSAGGMKSCISDERCSALWAAHVSLHRADLADPHGEGFGGKHADNLSTSRKNAWFHYRSPYWPEDSSSPYLDTRELDARLFPGDHFAQPCSSTNISSREGK